MNICYVDCDKPKDNGLSTYTRELISAYQTQNVLSICCIWTDSFRYPVVHEEVIDHIRQVYIPFVPRNKGRDYDAECAAVIMGYVRENPDTIVHFNWINHCSIAWILKQRIKVITVLTKHCLPWRDLITFDYPQFYQIHSAFKKGLPLSGNYPQFVREKIYYDSIDHIITVTQFAKKSLTQLFGLPEDKITVVKNGLSAEKGMSIKATGKSRLRAKYGFNSNEKIILYAGNVNPRKGIYDLIQAFEQLSAKQELCDIRLVIAGAGNHQDALKVVKRYWSKITFTGVLAKDTLRDFYQLSDIGVVPSYVEQCSYTVIEMMHYGLPVIVSDVDGLQEMVDCDCGLKFSVVLGKRNVSIDKSSLAAKMNFLLQHKDQAALYASNARSFALKHFAGMRMADETLNIYRSVWAQHNPSDQIQYRNLLATPCNHLVTIILPCYNAGLYLKECIESILVQTYLNFELIIVDDGSTDNTTDILKEIKDPRIVLKKNTKNLGITHCLNYAISISRGSYIARMDADDLMMPDRLELQVEFLNSNRDYAAVGSGYNVIDIKGMPINRIKPVESNDELRLTLFFFNPFAHPTMMMRSEVSKSMLYDPEYEYCEDYELWFRIAALHKMANLAQPLLSYRIHEENSSSKNSQLMKQNVIGLLSRELDHIGVEHNAEELILHSAISFGYGLKYFNTPDKVVRLNQWLQKLFASTTLNEAYRKPALNRFKKSMLKKALGV